MKRIFNLRNLVILLISILIGAIISFTFLFIRGFNLYNSMDAFFVACAVLIASSLIYLATNEGSFDVISVGFSNLFSTMKKNGSKKYDGLFEYREIKNAKRSEHRFSFLPILVSGVIYLIISIILFIIYKNK